MSFPQKRKQEVPQKCKIGIYLIVYNSCEISSEVEVGMKMQTEGLYFIKAQILAVEDLYEQKNEQLQKRCLR